MAALLQALVAIALVGAAGFVFRATASEMNCAADWIVLASYCAVAAMGLWLVWRKGGALIAALSRHVERRRAVASSPGLCGRRVAKAGVQPVGGGLSRRAARRRRDARRGMRNMSTRPTRPSSTERSPGASAAGTVIAAGARPCSGAILVLVFAMAQGLFAAGDRRDLRHGDRHRGYDRRARLDGRVRQVGRHAPCGGREFAPRAGGEGISNSPPPSPSWCSASP